ncbi:hypothetical protein [Cohnella boryungensis]|uniref:Uncharacterized protein n=1 Tax=Cohnella boryungensis TaxID=768479 RepID=A0ABV8S5E4_9BACL
MSPIYGAIFLWLIATILWWSGWKEEAAEDLPQWAVGLFLAGWPLTLLARLDIPAVTVNGAWAWTFLSIAAMACRMVPNRRWAAVALGLLLASIAIVVGRLLLIPNGLSYQLSPWVISIALGCLTAMLFRSAAEQLLAISVSLLLSEAALSLTQAAADLPSELRSLQGLEKWWLTLFCARLWTLAVRRLSEQTRRRTIRINGRKGGYRS